MNEQQYQYNTTREFLTPPKLIQKIKINGIDIWCFENSLKYYTTLDTDYFHEIETIKFSGKYSVNQIIKDSLISDHKEIEDNILIIDKFLAEIKTQQPVCCEIEIETLAQYSIDGKLINIDKKIGNYRLLNIVIDEINISYEATFVKEKF